MISFTPEEWAAILRELKMLYAIPAFPDGDTDEKLVEIMEKIKAHLADVPTPDQIACEHPDFDDCGRSCHHMQCVDCGLLVDTPDSLEEALS